MDKEKFYNDVREYADISTTPELQAYELHRIADALEGILCELVEANRLAHLFPGKPRKIILTIGTAVAGGCVIHNLNELNGD